MKYRNRNWFFQTLFILISILPLNTWAGANSLQVTDARSLAILEVGDNTFIENRSEAGIFLGSIANWAPRLIGDTVVVPMDQPQIKYQIHVLPRDKSFYLQIGTQLIQKKVRFFPRGTLIYEKLGSYEEFYLNQAQRQKAPPYYVSEVHLGARRTQAFSFLQTQDEVPLPQKAHYEFEGTAEGEESFKETLRGMFQEFSGKFTLESDAVQRVEIPATERGVFSNAGIAAPQLVAKRASVTHFWKRSAGPSVEEINRRIIHRDVEGYLATLKTYIRDITEEGKSEPQLIFIDPHPLEDAGPVFTELSKDFYSKVVPKLADLAKKYSVEIYQSFEEQKGEGSDESDGKVICRIHLYPELRGNYARVRTSASWIHVEGRAKIIEHALMEAFFILPKELKK